MAKHRLERINELLKREMGDLLRREIHFDAQLVTVQHVDVTPDLKNAHVFMSVIGTEKQRKGVMSLLRTRCPHLQFLLSRRVIMKYTPHLHFKLDEGIERGTRIINLMDELHLLPKNEEPGVEGSDLPTAPPLP
ncbi:MAG: ribosome-binding factor A [Verrucomicrobia bacterium]|nr:MAG: ribosome-binding factor A [Verrucomicrobiota bacterium]